MDGNSCPAYKAALAAWLQLDAGIFVIPRKADHGGIIFIHGLLHGGDGLAVVLLGKRLALEHQVVGLRKENHVEALRNGRVCVHGSLYTLHVYGGARLAIFVRQPQARGLAAKGIHAQKQPPHVAADLLAIGKVVLGLLSAPHDDPALRLVKNLNEEAPYVVHRLKFLSQHSKFYAVGNKQRDGNRVPCVGAGRKAEFAHERARVAVHAAEAKRERRVGNAVAFAFQSHSRTRQPQATNVIRRCQPGQTLEQPVGMPRRKHRRAPTPLA